MVPLRIVMGGTIGLGQIFHKIKKVLTTAMAKWQFKA